MAENNALFRFSCLVYLATGVILTAFGPLIPDIAAYYGVGYKEVASFFLLNSILFIPTVLSAGILAQRFGTRFLLAAGLVIMALGFAGLALSANWILGMLTYAIGGVGFAILDASLNTLVLDLSTGKQGSALNWLHVFPSIGAVLGPFLARGLFAVTGMWQAVFWTLSLSFLILSIALLRYTFPPAAGGSDRSTGRTRALLSNSTLILLGLGMTLYVGVEMGVSNWMYAYLVTGLHATEMLGAGLNSLFWFGLGVGRVFAARFTESIGYATSIFMGTVGTAGALTLALGTQSIPVVTLAFLFAGFAFAGTFPTLLALGGRLFPTDSGLVSGVLIGFAGFGGLLLPPGIGFVAEAYGIRAGMLVAYGAALALVLVTGLLAAHERVQLRTIQRT